ncbi:Dual specificity protein phosphatase 10 [Mortierella sp. NVP85]|nr:Dual specificity protein phosphatase 10 [Mortierella sp. NVP85]
MPTAPSSSPSPLLRPLLAQDMKKMRNSKQLSLKVLPLSGSAASDSSSNNSTDSGAKNASLPAIVTPSLPSTPSSTSLSTRRPFTPAPLSSASLHTSCNPPSSIATPTSKRQSQLLLDDALPTPRLPLPTTTSHRSISAYFSDYSLECGAASPYISEPVSVLPNLYLGAEHNASDIRTLRRLGITFVLNVAIEIAQESELGSVTDSTKVNETRVVRGGVEFRTLAWTHHQKNLLRDFPTAFELIDEAVASNNGNGKALVHCQLGVSRSASLVIAYVMRSLGMGLTEAYDFVKQRSSVISPNMSLMYQLAEFEKYLKNPESFVASVESPLDSASNHRRYSMCSQQDDDEPPYPFSAAFSAAASEQPHVAPILPPSASRSMDDFLPPATPIRHEFCKRPHTPEATFDDHPNTKPFQGPSRLMASPKSFLAARRGRSQARTATDLARRSPLKASVSSESLATPKVPFHIHSHRRELEMVPPATPLFQSSFTVPSLTSSSNSSSASSVSSLEDCPRPSISSTLSSTSTYFTACDDDEDTMDDEDHIFCSPRNSGAWSSMPTLCMPAGFDLMNEKEAPPEPKKKKTNALWSGFKALQGIKDTASSAIASMSSSTSAAAVAADKVSTTPKASSSSSPSSSSSSSSSSMTGTAALSTLKKVPDFIFSPRSFVPSRHHESRSFGDFYQALCTEGSS